MICVIATIDLVPGSREEFLAVFAELSPKVRAEEGCREYAAMVDLATSLPVQPPARSDTVVVVEKWESVDALEQHLMAPHMQEFRKATEALRRGLSLQVLEPAV
jgi:quinol monooxygenase YgiN